MTKKIVSPLAPRMTSQILWIFVGYTLLVILWGAWVRISHSGDGCGESWPLCQGEWIPTARVGKTWVELSHRLMSGLFGIFVLGIFLALRRRFPPSHPVRRAALIMFIFTITEAFLGARLVLSGLVGNNASPLRVAFMGLHFVNSGILMASIAAVAVFAGQEKWTRRVGLSESFQRAPFLRPLPWGALILIILLGVTGTIAALSTTLFPSLSLVEGFSKDLSVESHFLLRLRAIHPLLGVFGGLFAAILFLIYAELTPDSQIHRRSRLVALAMSCALIVGTVTLLWLSPIPLRLLHLALAHGIVIALTRWGISLLFQNVKGTPGTL